MAISNFECVVYNICYSNLSHFRNYATINIMYMATDNINGYKYVLFVFLITITFTEH